MWSLGALPDGEYEKTYELISNISDTHLLMAAIMADKYS